MSRLSPGVLHIELHCHKDDNFKKKFAVPRGPTRFQTCLFISFVASFLFELRSVSCARQPVPCNRTRQVLTEEYGSIEDGPRDSNYTGNWGVGDLRD